MPPQTPTDATRRMAIAWGVALAVALPVLVVAVRWVRGVEVPPSVAFHDHNLERVADFAAAIEGGAEGVVLLGDSRLRYGTAPSLDLSAALSDAAGRDVAVLRLTSDWAVIEDFVTLFPAVIDAGPELVVFQHELRARDRGLDATELLQREYVWWRLFGRHSWDPGDRDQDALQHDVSCATSEPLEQRRARLDQWIRFSEDGPAAQTIAGLRADLARHQIDYRFVHVPVTASAEAGLPGVEPPPGALTPASAIDIPDDHYCDLVHLDPTGRAMYTDWLVESLAAELNQPMEPQP